MALSRIKTWGAEVLLFTDLNAEFDNLINNAMTLLSPWTTNMAAGGYRLTGLGLGAAASPSLQFTGDTDTGIFSSGANTLDLATAGTSWLTLSSVGILTANGTTGAIRLHNLTTAQRDALTPAAGMLVYNTSTGAANVYTSAWGAIGSSGSGGSQYFRGGVPSNIPGTYYVNYFTIASASTTTETPYYGVSDQYGPTQIVATRSGTVKRLYVYLTAALSGGSTHTYTMRKNGSDQSVTFTIPDGAQSGSDTSNSFSVAAGDLISIKLVIGTANSTASSRQSIAFEIE